MKNGTLSTKLMLAAILLAVLVYFGINLAAYFMDPFTTTVAYDFTSENAVTVSGYVVREETVLEGSGGELVYFSRDEGEKVAKGGTVAQIYDSAEALSAANTLRSLNEQLEQLTYARSLVSGSQSTARLDEEVSSSLISFQSALASGSLSAAEDAGSSLRASVLKRSYAYSGTDELDAAIAALESQISSLSAATSSGTTRITAPEGGLFSSLVDGYETVLTPQALEEMTPKDYRSIQPEEAAGVGRLISGYRWYFATLMRESDLGKLAEGDTITLRFQTGLDRDLTMQVDRISDEDGGQRLVVFASEQYLNLTTLLRHQNAQVIFDSYTGIRVPRSAVRILWEPVTDEDGAPVLKSDGTQEQRQVMGVYCVWGNTARFKPVDVVWQEDEYLLVVPSETALAGYMSESTREGRRLRAGDEVITAAADLYDGKVIRS